MTVSLTMEKGSLALLLEDAMKNLEQGRLPLSMFSDPDIFDLEVEQLWPNVWNFLAHETEIPKPGDYVVRSIGPYDSVILIRNEDGKISAFANICAHRGMRICRVDMGNTSHFRCPYHGWTYNDRGKLIGVPFRPAAYGDFPILEKYAEGLKPVRVEGYDGFIFGNLNEKNGTLSDYLGDYKWYFDLIAKRTPLGLEFYPPLRHVANFNWKMGAENIGTDDYHFETTHKSLVDAGLSISYERMGGVQTCINGHGVNLVTVPGESMPQYGDRKKSAIGPMESMVGWPEFSQLLQRSLTKDQFQAMRRAVFVHGNVFPNLSFTLAMGEAHVDFRMWRPISPTQTEVLFWCGVDKDSPEDVKQRSIKEYAFNHGVAGTIELDDKVMWEGITSNSASVMARRMSLNYDVGIRSRGQVKDWPGPGKMVGIPNESNAIEMWKELLKYLGR